MGESAIARDRESLREMIDRWLWMWNYRKPVIAQTHGYCLSGGLDLIGACDIVFAAEGTLFGHPAARGMGIPVTLGMMPMKIGAAATKELLFTGDTIDAAEAERIGLIAHVVPADELDERVSAFCQRVALNPLDVLTVHKHVTNRWSEVMNVRLAAFEGAEYDAIAHLTPSMARVQPAHRARTACGPRSPGATGRTARARPPTTTRRCAVIADAAVATSGRCASCTRPTSTSATRWSGPAPSARWSTPPCAHDVDVVVLVGDTFDHNRVHDRGRPGAGRRGGRHRRPGRDPARQPRLPRAGDDLGARRAAGQRPRA